MEIAVISGKGGTGKSSISAALATLNHPVVLADCDVDAANLYILFNPVHETEQVYVSGETAVIDEELCTQCGLCIDYCRFDAISEIDNKVTISETFCDGCQLCSRICPANAISMVKNDKSRMYSGPFRNGKMVYGRLAPGEENSGKLVNLVREKAREIAKKENIDTIIIDGPPGIGCPVISTITGVDHVLIGTEPTLSGLMDLKRTLEVTTKFNLKTWVLINKYDLNKEMTKQIEAWCQDVHVPVVGKLPFNSQVVQAMVNCQSIMEYDATSDFALGIQSAYNKIINGAS
ncbi:MAG: ATP-binding protein [Salinivirgaceae bacterium]|jgi:MinD superfamily P-loop ATPase